MRTEEKEKLLETVHGWIQATDQKISIFIAFLGIVIAVSIGPAYDLFKKSFYKLDNYITPFFILCGFSLIVVASLLAIWGIKGRVRPDHVKNKKDNLKYENSVLFFYGIASMNLEEFREKLNNIKDYSKEIENQIYLSSKICSKKMEYLNYSIYCFLISLIFLFLAVINYLYVR